MGKKITQEKIEQIETQLRKTSSLGYKDRAKSIFKELVEIKQKQDEIKILAQDLAEEKKDIFLLITHNDDIFNPALPARKLVGDIASVVPELYVVYVGKKQKEVPKLSPNAFIYTVPYIPLFNFFTVRGVVMSQLVWKHHFLPTKIISIGDEMSTAKIFSKKYHVPLYVFYSYINVLGDSKASMSALLSIAPDKVMVPNEYVSKVITNNFLYKPNKTKVKILNEYIDVPELRQVLDTDNFRGDVNLKSNIFNMVLFPRAVDTGLFLMLKKITKEISSSIKKFRFNIVVGKTKYIQARLLAFLFRIPVAVHRENKDSVNLFHMSRFMLYFDEKKVSYEPVLYSFISGCPVLSTGDEYSKLILFGSELEEFGRLERKGKVFGATIKKLTNDPYLYEKYKVNCTSFAKSAFTHDHEAYVAELRDVLNSND